MSEEFTRVVPFDSIVREEYRGRLRDRSTQLCGFIREVVTRAQVFVNAYVIENSERELPSYIFLQTFWYSVCQLILDKNISNTNTNFPEDLQPYWIRFRRDYPDIVYPLGSFSGYSDALAAACITLKTSYTNHVVENFYSRVSGYCEYRLRQLVPVHIYAHRSGYVSHGLHCRIYVKGSIENSVRTILQRSLQKASPSGLFIL